MDVWSNVVECFARLVEVEALEECVTQGNEMHGYTADFFIEQRCIRIYLSDIHFCYIYKRGCRPLDYERERK
jgi:hypothetical protein